jgi:dipeptidyl-peptidase 4
VPKSITIELDCFGPEKFSGPSIYTLSIVTNTYSTGILKSLRSEGRVMFNRLFLATFWLYSACFAQNISISDIINSNELHSQTLSDVHWHPNGKAFTFTKKNASDVDLWICNANNGKMQIMIDGEILGLKSTRKEKRHIVPNYLWSPDGRKILVPSQNDLTLFDVESKTLLRLTNDDAEERDPTFSPDGSKIAYLKNNNLSIYDLVSHQERMLTNHGTKKLLIGRFDWTYEEELSIRTGFEWSPNSQHISFFQLDVTPIPEFPIVDFSNFQNSVEMMRYSKAGDANANVKNGVMDTQTKKTVWMNCSAGADSSYISRTSWFPSSDKLAITWLNRQQNHLKLHIADIHSGATKVLFEEKSITGWVKPKRKPKFITDHSLVWLSEEDGYNHIYVHNTKKNIKEQLTRGTWDVNKIIHTDKEYIYFAAYKESPINLDVYRIGVDGSDLRKLSQRNGGHSIKMSPDGRYYIDTYSTFRSPASVSLHHADGKHIAQLTQPPQKALDIMKDIDIESIEIPLAGRTHAALMMKSATFDSTKPHPLLIYCYGGPGSHHVKNAWHNPRTLWHSMLVNKGYLVLLLDPRGAADRGAAWKHSVYKHLGNYEIQDHVDAAMWAGGLPYVDQDRIGIWGWSYGGYTTIMGLLKGNDAFKMGVSVSPVTDWRNYDSIYTERFMDTPTANESGYDAGSAMNYAQNLKGRLLLIHGSSDYNVHMSNSMQFSQKLQEHGKDFEVMLYPGKTHGLLGAATRVHVYDQIYEFILNNL